MLDALHGVVRDLGVLPQSPCGGDPLARIALRGGADLVDTTRDAECAWVSPGENENDEQGTHGGVPSTTPGSARHALALAAAPSVSSSSQERRLRDIEWR